MTEKITFSGLVQGQGFRPAAKRLALNLGISGEIKNSGGVVTVTATGREKALSEFIESLAAAFEIFEYKITPLPEKEYRGFSIVPSDSAGAPLGMVPDIATCPNCEKELFDKNNRRYHHPFISCTACGPRYSIMEALPFDRENTAMARFPMCGECEKEYNETENRRCWAQTIACNECGPKLNMPLEDAVKILKECGVLAIKDTGGFHLACRADCREAVLKIRGIKGREQKPFAVMFQNIEEIEEYCFINETERQLLTSPARPIVLLKKKREMDESVAGNSAFTGAFLPSNPVQLMLLREVSPLIMTSANISGEMMAITDEEASKFNVPLLTHDRAVLTPLDDSVLQVVCESRVQFIRRARGYVPLGIKTSLPRGSEILATGGDLKAAFCFTKDSYCYLSASFGDLESVSCIEAYQKEIARFKSLFHLKDDRVVSDLHPAYYSANLYKNAARVQHHTAHAASVMAEHNLQGETLNFVFDGTGYGTDGAIWGAEVFTFDGKNFSRREHLNPVRMPANDRIAKDAALALKCYTKEDRALNKVLDAGISTVEYTGMGRLFDAVSALLGVCGYNDYEGECASKLEGIAATAKTAYQLTPTFSPREIIAEIKRGLDAGVSVPSLALGFHQMLVRLVVETAKKYNIPKITLSGGVFINRLLTEGAVRALQAEGFSVYINEKVPTSDGGIALGQAYMALNEWGLK